MQGHVWSLVVRHKQAVIRWAEEEITIIVETIDRLPDRKKVDSIIRR